MRRFIIALLAIYHGLLVIYGLTRLTLGDSIPQLTVLHTFALHGLLPIFITAPLAWLLKARRTAVLGVLLALIIGLWQVVPVLPKALPTPSGTVLKVLTFNLYGWNERFETALTWLLEQDADLIILQEIIEEEEAPERLAPLREAYEYQSFIKGNVRVFSRYSMLERDLIVTEGGPVGHLSLRTVLDLNGEKVAVYGAHFALPIPLEMNGVSLSPFNFMTSYDEARRNAQMERLLESITREPYPYILAGDFNMSATSLQYDRFARLMRDSWVEAGTGFGHSWPVAQHFNWPRFLPPLIRIDYIWHSADFRAVEAFQGPYLGSDHLPLVVMLELIP